jgi:hypothetical protein
VGSFDGGFEFEVTHTPGLTTSMRASTSSVTLCGSKATLVKVGSNSTKTKFKVPPAATATTYSTFGGYHSGQVLSVVWTGVSVAEMSKLNDGNLANSVIDAGASCSITASLPAGQKGVVDEVSVYINGLYASADSAKINGHLFL